MKPTLRGYSRLFIFCLFAAPAVGVAQLTQQWVSRFEGPISDESMIARKVKADASGNSYVTGWLPIVLLGSYKFYNATATIKYDADGNQLWYKKYQVAPEGRSISVAMEVDEEGNVYVAGTESKSLDFAVPTDIFLVKYSPAGDQLWVRTYDGPGGSPDNVQDMALDKQGNIYLCGSSQSAESGFVVLKYDASGTRLWVKRLEGDNDEESIANSIAIDNQESIIVSGAQTPGPDTVGRTLIFAKFSSSGTQQWVKFQKLPNTYDNYPGSVELDDSGNIYTAAQSATTTTSWDFLTIKYSSTGSLLWQRRFSSPTPKNADQPKRLVIDKNGDVIIAGNRNTGYLDGSECLIIKYNAAGTLLWTQTYKGAGRNKRATLNDMAVDASGNISVTGWSNNFSDNNLDFLTIQYDASGNQLSLSSYRGLTSRSEDEATSMSVDPSGNVFVTGRSGNDFATIKYTPSTSGPLVYEAELATRYRVDTFNIHKGFTGTGFADFINKTDDYMEWSLQQQETGNSTISIRYANGAGTDRPLQLSVNGVVQDTLSFVPTSGWAQWSYAHANVNLAAGNNTIRLRATGAGGPNIDHLLRTGAVQESDVLEAEGARLINARIAYNHPGFTGTGFADIINLSLDYVEWELSQPSAGAATLSFRYALRGSNRSMRLEVNGVVANPAFSFTNTGAWDNWSYINVNTQLKAGANKIRLTAIGNGGPNIDHLKWSAGNVAASKTAPKQALPGGTNAGASVLVVPNPASGMARVITKTNPSLPVTIKVINASGKTFKQLRVQATDDSGLNLSVAGWPQGFYTIVLQQGSATSQAKLIVRR